MKCSLCGFEFSPDDAQCKTGCAMNRGCKTICCPHCGYQMVGDSAVLTWMKKIEPVVSPLNKLKTGQTGKIVYVSTKHHARLDRLTDLGLTPGEEIRVHQTLPAFVVQVRETDIAVDTDVLKDIYVRRSK